MTDNNSTALHKKTIRIKGQTIKLNGKFAKFDQTVPKVSDRVKSIFDYPEEERNFQAFSEESWKTHRQMGR